MKTLKFLAMAVTLIFGAAAVADDVEKHEMKIVIESESSDGSAGFTWISNDPGFDMESMQVGETQSIVDESGKSVLITREADGFRFDVDGESIVMPNMSDHPVHVAMIDGMDISGDIDVEVIGDHQMMSGHAGNGVTIITGEALDGSTQESIKAVLQSVGRGDDVTFIDGSGGDGRQVMIMKKQVEILQ